MAQSGAHRQASVSQGDETAISNNSTSPIGAALEAKRRRLETSSLDTSKAMVFARTPLSASSPLQLCFPSLYLRMAHLESAVERKDTETLLIVASTLPGVYFDTIKAMVRPFFDPKKGVICERIRVKWRGARSVGKLYQLECEHLEGTSPPDPTRFPSIVFLAQRWLETLEALFAITVGLRDDAPQDLSPSLPLEGGAASGQPANVDIQASSNGERDSGTLIRSSSATSATAVSIQPQLQTKTAATKTPIIAPTRTKSTTDFVLPSPHQRLVVRNPSPSTLPSPRSNDSSTAAAPTRQKALSTSGPRRVVLRRHPSPEDDSEDIYHMLRQSILRIRGEVIETYHHSQRPTSVEYDSNGNVVAATIRSIARIITSEEVVADPILLENMFTVFRVNSTPQELLQALKNRFKDTNPCGVYPFDQETVTVWECQRRGTRNRVIQVLTYWIDKQFDTKQDLPVLKDIKEFSEDLAVVTRVDASVLNQLQQQIQLFEKGPSNPTATNKKAPSLRSVVTLTPRPKSFTLFSQLMVFNTYKGRLLVARQLTAILSNMFAKFTAADMVKYLMLDQEGRRTLEGSNDIPQRIKDFLVAQDFEQALVLWVAHTIVEQRERPKRVASIQFWMDIAIHCLELRNYSSSNSIFQGIAHHTVSHMKETVLCVSVQAKGQYHRLEKLFSSPSRIQQAMSQGDSPMIPLLAPFRSRIATANEVLPTTVRVANSRGSGDIELINLNKFKLIFKDAGYLQFRLPSDLEVQWEFHDWLMDHMGRFLNFHKYEELSNELYEKSQQRERANPAITNQWSHIVLNTETPDFTPTDLLRLSSESLSDWGDIIPKWGNRWMASLILKLARKLKPENSKTNP